jgi:hypothetical protein
MIRCPRRIPDSTERTYGRIGDPMVTESARFILSSCQYSLLNIVPVLRSVQCRTRTVPIPTSGSTRSRSRSRSRSRQTRASVGYVTPSNIAGIVGRDGMPGASGNGIGIGTRADPTQRDNHDLSSSTRPRCSLASLTARSPTPVTTTPPGRRSAGRERRRSCRRSVSPRRSA